MQTILLAEDKAASRTLLTEYLNTMGYSVIAVENGALALDAYLKDKEAIACLVTDLEMPVMTGAELITRIRATDTTLPMLVISGVIKSSADIAGANSVLAKPFSLADFRSSLETMLRR